MPEIARRHGRLLRTRRSSTDLSFAVRRSLSSPSLALRQRAPAPLAPPRSQPSPSLQVRLPPCKADTYGLGYDPFQGAEEFRALKRAKLDAAGGGGGRGGGSGGGGRGGFGSRPVFLSDRGGAGGRGRGRGGSGAYDDDDDEAVYGSTAGHFFEA